MKRHLNTHTRGRFDRPFNRAPVNKTNPSGDVEENKGSQTRTIQGSLVDDLKLEVEANGVVEIVRPEDNPESILPHEGGQNLDYSVTRAADTGTDRDPLEADVRSTDQLYVSSLFGGVLFFPHSFFHGRKKNRKDKKTSRFIDVYFGLISLLQTVLLHLNSGLRLLQPHVQDWL